MIRRLIAIATIGLAATFAVAVPAHAAEPAAAVAFHGHIYDCAGVAGYNTACVDPTTGYGPVLWLCQGTNCSWSTGISSAALYSTFDQPTPVQRWGWNAGAEFYNGSAAIGVPGYISPYDGCNTVCAAAFMSQAVFNQVIYISNSSGIDYVRFVH